MTSYSILVVGCGSIGKRHLQNLHALNIGILFGCDSSKQRLLEAQERFNLKKTFLNLHEALHCEKFHAVFVCVPTSEHIPIALSAAAHGAHIFLEKPVSNTMDQLVELSHLLTEKNLTLMVGYHLRFHPALQRLKAILEDQIIGRIYTYHVECGQYLPHWHPSENYRDFYMSKKEQGGGALLDITHEIDYPQWFFGKISQVSAMVDTVSDLEITSDDLAHILVRHENGILGHIHLDLLQQTYQRNIKIIGQKGTIIWDFVDKKIKLFTTHSQKWIEEIFTQDKNEWYLKEIKYFFQCIEKKMSPPVDLASGEHTLKVALAAFKSSAQQQHISVA